MEACTLREAAWKACLHAPHDSSA